VGLEQRQEEEEGQEEKTVSLLRLGLLAAGGFALWRAFWKRDQLPEHLAYLTVTSTGLDNDPPAEIFPALELLHKFLEAVRRNYGALEVTSGYRSGAVNAAVGGVSDSLHLVGRAVDFRPLSVSPAKLYDDWRAAPHAVTGLIQEAILYEENGQPVRLHVGLAVPGTEPTPKFFRDQKERT